MKPNLADDVSRLAFWSAAYLALLHRGTAGEKSAKQQADQALRDFDAKVTELSGPKNSL